MGRITSLFARKVVGQVDPGADAGALLRTVGLEGDGEVDPSFMIRDDDYYLLFERAAAADRDATTLPLRVGASMRCDDYGPFGFAWKSAPTLRGSYERAVRYALVLTSVALYEVEECFGGAYMPAETAGHEAYFGCPVHFGSDRDADPGVVGSSTRCWRRRSAPWTTRCRWAAGCWTGCPRR